MKTIITILAIMLTFGVNGQKIKHIGIGGNGHGIGFRDSLIYKSGNMLDTYGWEANPPTTMTLEGHMTKKDYDLLLGINEQQAIKKTHIDLTKEYVFFVISGLIEIDGHTFRNDTCKSPIVFQATLDGVTIINPETKIKYKHRKCDKKDCNVIHLKNDCVMGGVLINPSYPFTPYFKLLHDGITTPSFTRPIMDTLSTDPNYQLYHLDLNK